MLLTRYIKTLPVAFLLSVLLLLSVAIYNGYPLITSDTGSYINHAFDFQIPADRSPFYGVFLAFASMWTSLWLAICVQAILLAWLLFQFSELVCGKRISGAVKLLFVVATAIFTAAAWVTGYIMPDIFTAVLLLAIILLLHVRKNQKILFVCYTLIIYSSVFIHNSHFLIFFLFSLIVFLVSLARKYRGYLKKAGYLLCLSLFCVVSMCTLNFVKGFGFTLSPGSHVFMMGRLSETGILKKYLDEHCKIHPYKLCQYKDALPPVAWEFLWDGESPLYKTGGWDSSKAEYTAIISDIFRKPEYIGCFAKNSAIATFRQLASITVDAERLDSHSSPGISISKHYPRELKACFQSRQSKGTLNGRMANNMYIPFFIASSIWVMALFRRIVNRRRLGVLYGLIILFIACNAFVTATFANVLARLQIRVFWVLPAMNILVLIYYYMSRGREGRIKNKEQIL